MKKITSILLTALILCTVIPLAAIPASAKGTEIRIENEHDWEHLAHECSHSDGYLGDTVVLVNDIDLTHDSRPDLMLGSEVCPFKGTFKGNGHTVKVSFEDLPAASCGLFAYCENATIENLVIEGSVSAGEYYNDVRVKDNDYVTPETLYACGGVCGLAKGRTHIENCINTASVSGIENVGGICGIAEGGTSIQNCVNNGTVSGEKYVGGVCGALVGDAIGDGINNAELIGDSAVGGVCGNLVSGRLLLCVNNAVADFPLCGEVTENEPLTSCYMLTEGGFASTADGINADEGGECITADELVGLLNDLLFRPGFRWIDADGAITFESDQYAFNSASVLPEGSLTVIVGVAAAVVFGLGGFFIGRKTKSVAADGAKSEEE